MNLRADGPSLAEMAAMETIVGRREGGPSGEQRLDMLVRRRAESPERSAWLDQALLGELDRRDQGLREASDSLDKLKEIIDKLTEPPWHTGIYLGAVETEHGPRPMVQFGNGRHVVNLGETESLDNFLPGDEVFLNHDLTALVRRSPLGVPQVGETAAFDRLTEDGRLVVQSRDEELILRAAGVLDARSLKSGDLVRWDKGSWMAYERVQRGAGRHYFLDDVPDARPDQVGGQRGSLQMLLGALKAKLVAPELARLYGLEGQETILMIGPPGCGKTLLARVAAAEISRISGKKCRFAVVKPGQWEDPYVGVTQRNIRECFEALGEAAKDGFAVLFLDEIESAGRLRGASSNLHGDKFLGALLAELDGFAGRDSVAIIAASNRKDLVDPALLQRLSGIEIAVSRPDRRGAKEIFGIHLGASIPYNPNGEAAAETREEIIDLGVSQFYSPNGENELCTLRFRDGATRTVAARELASGRVIEQICRDARRSAFQRHVDGGEPGLTVDDMSEAVSAAIERLATTLTPGNAHAYLFDLPQDVDVVAVDAAARPAGRSHRYLHRN